MKNMSIAAVHYLNCDGLYTCFYQNDSGLCEIIILWVHKLRQYSNDVKAMILLLKAK